MAHPPRLWLCRASYRTGPSRRLAGAALALIIALIVPAAQAFAQRSASLVIDAASGEVFHEDNARRPVYPASLTKLMTLYLTFRALNQGSLTLNQRLPVSVQANRQPASRLGLPIGATIRVEDAIYALVTESANDVAVVLAEAVGGSEARFAQLMTQQARRLGMVGTVFRNASGLPNDDQHTTAADMARLAQALIRDFPQYYHYFGTENWRYRGVVHRNHNRLLGVYAGMDGMKTGYIRASGFNLVASAVRGRRRLIAVVFGGETAEARNQRVVELLDAGFASRRGTSPIARSDGPPEFVPPTPSTVPVRATPPTAPPLPGLPPGLGIASVLASSTAAASDSAEIAELPTPPLPDRRPGDPVTAAAPAVRPMPGALAGVPRPALMPTRRRVEQRQLAARDDLASDVGEEGDRAPAPEEWGIQVGVFNSEAAARRATRQVQARYAQLLSDATPSLHEQRNRRGRRTYAARLLGLDHQTAMESCSRLTAARSPCTTIAP